MTILIIYISITSTILLATLATYIYYKCIAKTNPQFLLNINQYEHIWIILNGLSIACFWPLLLLSAPFIVIYLLFTR